MKHLTRHLALVITLILLAVTLDGCGARRAARDVLRDDEPRTSRQEPATAPTSTSQAPAQAQAPAPAGEGLLSGTINHQGLSRSYLLYVPTSYRAGKPMPLLLVFHGGGGNAEGIAKSTQLDRLAEKSGFIVAFPNGTGRGDKKLTWNAGMVPPQGYAEKNNIDDVGFIRALLSQLKRSYTIDNRRVYATGISKGGMFTYRLGCEMADQFAGIAPVAATQTTPGCHPSQPISLLHIHGSDDTNVPLEGGHGDLTARNVSYPPVLAGIESWRRFDQCSAEKTQSQLSGDTTCWRYQGCATGTGVQYCIVDKGGHAWPGSDPKSWQEKAGVYVTQTFSASSVIWQYLSEHVLH